MTTTIPRNMGGKPLHFYHKLCMIVPTFSAISNEGETRQSTKIFPKGFSIVECNISARITVMKSKDLKDDAIPEAPLSKKTKLALQQCKHHSHHTRPFPRQKVGGHSCPSLHNSALHTFPASIIPRENGAIIIACISFFLTTCRYHLAK